MGDLRFNVDEVLNKGYGDVSITGQSESHPALIELFNLTHIDGKKRISNEWLDQLTDESLAWWYQDDGHNARGNAVFHTEGYPKEDVELAVVWFQKRGYDAYIYKTRTYYIVRLRAESSRRMFDAIRPYIIPEMEYKILNHRKHKGEWGRSGLRSRGRGNT
jgi:hypothetical protein